MITGFNTDVDYDGRIYHVQTEDKGRENPLVESLVYSGGEIVTSRESSYSDLTEADRFTEAEVLRRMEIQHQKLIRDIRNGEFDPDGPKPFGYNLVSNRSLDEVVLDYLSSGIGLERIRIEMDEHPTLVEGAEPTLRIVVIAEGSERPVAGARVSVKLLSTQARPRDLYSGSTTNDGRVEATFAIPATDGASSAILCQAEAQGTNAEVKLLVQDPGS
jgi:hypothetical protein